MHRAGYRTAWIGKYLNGYQKTPRVVPPGWDRWYGQLGTRVFGYRLNQNGRRVSYGSQPRDYRTDVYRRKANRVVRSFAEQPDPFLLVVSTGVPHAEIGIDLPPDSNPRPAPRHVGAFSDLPLPTPPSFNEADVSDKPPNVAGRPPLDDAAIETIEGRYRTRLESMLAVDELVAALVRTLRAAGELQRTVIVYTSDNGYFFGEHRIPIDKRWVYEESIRVPLVVRGPGIPKHETVDQIAANIDLAPTFLDLAGAGKPRRRRLDGRSLAPVLDGRPVGRERSLILEYYRSEDGPAAPAYQGLRTSRYVFVRYRDGFRELYDLASDPYELENVAADPTYAAARSSLSTALTALSDCQGRACRKRVDVPD